MKKKILSILLTAALMAGMLAGCGSKSADSGNAGNAGGNAGGQAAEGQTFDGTVKLPLTEEKVTLKIWMPSDSTFFKNATDYNESKFFQEMEKRTNVHLEFEVPTDAQSDFGLMISAGAENLPDLICWPSYYTNGPDAAIDDGYFLELTPYLDTYLYNYNQVRQSDPLFMTDSVTDSGRVAYVNILQQSKQGPWVGMQIRQDWLDELGLDTPETYAELENVLVQFKEKKECYAPLAVDSFLCFLFGELSAGYGVKNDFINKDGKVVAGFATDEWKQFLTMMNDWFNKGLIDPDFTSRKSPFVEMSLPTTQASGVWYAMYTWPAMFEGALKAAGVENPEVKSLAAPRLNKGDIIHIRCKDQYIQPNGIAIAATSKNKEIAMQWVNYLFTKEGADLANYGIEGVSFNYNADGKPEFTDLVLNHTELPDGTMQDAMLQYTLVPSQMASHYDWTRELASVPEKDQECYTIWANDKNLDDWVMPAISMTAEESQERANMYTDIQSYVLEASTQFITGVKDINTEWDGYISTINGMGLERCVEITQAALDRYLAR